jgi:hypothetical protein
MKNRLPEGNGFFFAICFLIWRGIEGARDLGLLVEDEGDAILLEQLFEEPLSFGLVVVFEFDFVVDEP